MSNQESRDQKWQRIASMPDHANAPGPNEVNHIHLEIDDMIEDGESDMRILIHVLIQLAREQARTASALESLVEALEAK